MFTIYTVRKFYSIKWAELLLWLKSVGSSVGRYYTDIFKNSCLNENDVAIFKI